MIDEFGPDRDRLEFAIIDYQASLDEVAIMNSHQAAEANRQELFRRINSAPNGLQTLILMREELRKLLRDHPELRPIDQDFVHLFTSWFNKVS